MLEGFSNPVHHHEGSNSQSLVSRWCQSEMEAPDQQPHGGAQDHPQDRTAERYAQEGTPDRVHREGETLRANASHSCLTKV
jgi:hypothetical protein